MQNADVIALMRREAASILRQVERAQATAAALVQWYQNIGGDTWANGISDADWTAAGITKLQFKRAMADFATFPTLLNPTVLANVADAAYKVQLIG